MTVALLVSIPLVNAEIRTTVVLPFGSALLPQENEHALLLFAGYPGCAGVCPTTMNQLAAAKRSLEQNAGPTHLALAFVNLHFDATDQATQRYATSFHPDFLAFSTPSALGGELKNALAQAGSRNAADLQRHRGNVYLFTRNVGQWQLEKVFARLPAPAVLAADIADHLPTSDTRVFLP